MGTAKTDDFDEYAAAAWPRLVRAAVLLGCSPQDAEDLAQTALTRCLLHWGKVTSAEDRDAYVHRILVNAYISSRRRLWHGEQPTDGVPDQAGTADDFAGVLDRESLRGSLARLSRDQRVAIVLRFYFDHSEAQMASLLGVAAGTVKSRLSRALRALALDPTLAEQEELS
jgi:RNA polymerase sigma-70 factor (sigma-E family)